MPQEDRIQLLETRVSELQRDNAAQGTTLADLRARQEMMHSDFNRLLSKLDDIHSTIKPLSEWSAKSKGALAVIGSIVTLIFMIIGGTAVALVQRAVE